MNHTIKLRLVGAAVYGVFGSIPYLVAAFLVGTSLFLSGVFVSAIGGFIFCFEFKRSKSIRGKVKMLGISIVMPIIILLLVCFYFILSGFEFNLRYLLESEFYSRLFIFTINYFMALWFWLLTGALLGAVILYYVVNKICDVDISQERPNIW